MPSGPGLGHFCFHNNAAVAMAEHLSIGLWSPVTTREHANLQTNKTSKKQKTKKPEGCEQVSSIALWSEGCNRSRSRPRQLGPQHSSVLHGSRRADGTLQGMLSRRAIWWAQSALCFSQAGNRAKEEKEGYWLLLFTDIITRLVLFSKQRNSMRTKELGKFLFGHREPMPYFYPCDLM